jgi:uncharacterized protein YbjT (DUF2867 family)
MPVAADAAIVAVAGGRGFVGGAIARELASRGNRVIVLSRREIKGAEGIPALAEYAYEVRAADATRPETLAGALAGVEMLVISLAFRNSPVEATRRGQTFELVDAAGTESLVAAAKSAGVTRLVYISGAGAAADAPRHWFRAKWRAEEAVRGSGISFTILRPSWIYGPGDHSLNRFLGFARRLPFMPQIGNGRQILAPIFVDDVAALAADALFAPGAAGQTLEVGGPEAISMDEIVRRALRVQGRRRPILHMPTRLMKLMTAPLTLLPSPPMSPAAIDFIVGSAQVDTEPLRRVLPRRIRPLEEALETYLGRGPRDAKN